MRASTMKLPFEASPSEIEANIDSFVTAVFSCLESEFLVMPKGKGFVEYRDFEEGYEALKKATDAFHDFSPAKIESVVFEVPIALVVVRSILGLTPPEWAYIASQRTGVAVTQGYVRSLDRKIRMAPLISLKMNPTTVERVKALITAACGLLQEGVPEGGKETLHRLQKDDTQDGSVSLRSVAQLGVPYAMLLYERFLGRPFAAHRDSVSELIGDSLESAVEDVLTRCRVSYRKTKRAERIPGFDQAPDFVIPSEYNPRVVIEAKLTEDDGTARDKVTRIQHLHSISIEGEPHRTPRFQIIACIAGRGVGVRREDMKKLIMATQGKVFTPRNLDMMVEFSELRHFAGKE